MAFSGSQFLIASLNSRRMFRICCEPIHPNLTTSLQNFSIFLYNHEIGCKHFNPSIAVQTSCCVCRRSFPLPGPSSLPALCPHGVWAPPTPPPSVACGVSGSRAAPTPRMLAYACAFDSAAPDCIVSKRRGPPGINDITVPTRTLRDKSSCG